MAAKKEEAPAKEVAGTVKAEGNEDDQAAKKEEAPAKEVAKSTVSMRPPAGCGAFGFAGESYAPDKNGIVEIPAKAVGEALTHGYEVITEK